MLTSEIDCIIYQHSTDNLHPPNENVNTKTCKLQIKGHLKPYQGWA